MLKVCPGVLCSFSKGFGVVHLLETHRTVLNQILRQSTTHLADGPFAVLVDYIRILDFDVKRKYVRLSETIIPVTYTFICLGNH